MQRQLHGVRSALASMLAEFPLSSRDQAHAASRGLRLFSETMPGVRTLGILDAQGNRVASNRAELVGRNIREHEDFKSQHARSDPDTLYVSAPFTAVLGLYSINVSRVMLGPGGELLRFATATLDPDYFDVVARSVQYADDMTVSFVHGDGTRFFSNPRLPAVLGKRLNRPGAIFAQHVAIGKAGTVVSARLLVSGTPRMIANYSLQPAELQMDKPLVIGVARDLAGIYGGWERQTELYALPYALLSAAPDAMRRQTCTS